MANKFTFEFDVTGYAKVLSQMRALAGGIQQGGVAGWLGAFTSARGIAGSVPALAGMARFAGAVSVASGAIMLLGRAANDAAQQIRSFDQFATGLGSDAQTSEFLRRLGAVGGFNAGDAANRFAQSSKSGLGAAAAAEAGLSPDFDITSPVDRGKRLIKFLKHLRKLTESGNEEHALLLARQAGVDDAFGATRVSNETFRNMEAAARAWEDLASPENRRAAAEFNANLDRFQTLWSQFFLRLKIGAMPVATSALRVATNAGNSPKMGSFFGDILMDMLWPWLKKTLGLGDGGGGGTSALKESLDQNTLELRRLNGIYGGGHRARGAIPGGLQAPYGFLIQKHWRVETLKLGAYAVNM